MHAVFFVLSQFVPKSGAVHKKSFSKFIVAFVKSPDFKELHSALVLNLQVVTKSSSKTHAPFSCEVAIAMQDNSSPISFLKSVCKPYIPASFLHLCKGVYAACVPKIQHPNSH